MTILRAMVVIPRDTAIPADAVTNTWHFNTGGALLSTDAPEVRTRLLDVYNNATANLGAFLSKALNGDAARIKVYNLSDSEPRSPVLDDTFPITTISGNDPLPAETAICLSYHAAYVSGVPRARRRGRIYLGPVSSTVNAFVNNDLMVDTGAATNMNASLARLAAADTSLLKWSVYSVADGTAHAPVVGGWVDNAFDTQRRRGRAATIRTAWGS